MCEKYCYQKVIAVLFLPLGMLSALIFLIWEYNIFGIIIFIVIYELTLRTNGKRLNLYYTYTKENDGIYIHHNPMFIFYYADKDRLLRYRSDAIDKLIKKFPTENIFSETLTLQQINEDMGLEKENVKVNFWDRVNSYFITVANARNIKRGRIRRYFTRIDAVEGRKYVLYKRKNML